MYSGDPINRIGYKRGVIIGLLISAGGSALIYPAASAASYPFILSALFIIGLGLAMLQIAAQSVCDHPGTGAHASSRLNLSQAFNSFGTTIGPIIGGWLIFTVFTRPGAHGADSVKVPYLGFAAAYVLLRSSSRLRMCRISRTKSTWCGVWGRCGTRIRCWG